MKFLADMHQRERGREMDTTYVWTLPDLESAVTEALFATITDFASASLIFSSFCTLGFAEHEEEEAWAFAMVFHTSFKVLARVELGFLFKDGCFFWSGVASAPILARFLFSPDFKPVFTTSGEQTCIGRQIFRWDDDPVLLLSFRFAHQSDNYITNFGDIMF